MKLLFLDVDGVLNYNSNTYWSAGPLQSCLMVPAKVRNLETICKTTDCYIVVSSAWRNFGLGKDSHFQKHLKMACILDASVERFEYLMSRIVGETTTDDSLSREEQILEYVNCTNPEKFVAVDDNAELFPSNPDWLILTNDKIGLDDYSTYRIIRRLK